MKTVLVASSHLDDAILSAGCFIGGRPDCVVATVFAGTPPTGSVLTSYDVATGFKSAREAMNARRQEDIEALSVLGAKHRHLDFLDSQYGFELDAEALVRQLRELIEELDLEFVVAPIGAAHSDHQVVRDAMLEATAEMPPCPFGCMRTSRARVLWPESVIKGHGRPTRPGDKSGVGVHWHRDHWRTR